MSVFVALIFQVLFVFFAMVINIGLLVHDKINLQNAVDLGAYYAAQRQAELLNEIAHINYQIRQDFKLLTWRYRVLGMMGRHGGQNTDFLPPQRTAPGTPLQDTKRLYSYDLSVEEPPVVCVANEFWSNFIANSEELENLCYQKYNSSTPSIPPVQVIAPFLAINIVAAGFTKQSQQLQTASCDGAGVLNWAFAMQMLYAYRQAIAIRKQMIWSIRRNLISSNFRDINDQSVQEGVIKTVTKNLSAANRDTVEISFRNGLTLGGCDAQDGELLLSEIKIAPLLNYMWTHGSSCTYEMKAHTEYGHFSGELLGSWDPGGVMRKLSQGEPAGNDPLHSSLGFEKNPWCMAYVGVKATSRPHKPFAPFGEPIQLEARAFAQPFGGRIGPWYSARWPRGAPMSDLNEENRIDKMTPPRLVPGQGDIQYSAVNFPNYSRFPGDVLGLRSQLAMGAQRHIFSQLSTRPKNARLQLRYFDFAGAAGGIPAHGDPLLFDPMAPPDRALNEYPFEVWRRAEVAAIAPDLFDATYYSIDPAYYQNYHVRHLATPQRFTLMPLFGQPVTPISDLGSRGTNPSLRTFAVENQIQTSMEGGERAGTDPSLLPALTYPLREWEHLLTAWAPNRVNNFNFPEERFAKCDKPAANSVMIPGKCVTGGRSGYSVRLVSREHLLQGWKVGGDAEGPGLLLNPPPENF